MKTKLFTKFFVPSESFRETSKILVELPLECRNDLANWFNSLKIEPQRLETDFFSPPEALQEVATKLSLPTEKIYRLHEYILYLTRTAHRLHDDINMIVDDMAVLGIIPEESKQGIEQFFNQVLQKGIEFSKQRRRALYEKGQVPGLEEIDYDVDLRLIVEEPFQPLEKKIEDYQPKGMEFVPTAILSLKTNDDGKKEIARFQLNFNELEDLIITLQACQKELRLLQGFADQVKFSESS